MSSIASDFSSWDASDWLHSIESNEGRSTDHGACICSLNDSTYCTFECTHSVRPTWANAAVTALTPRGEQTRRCASFLPAAAAACTELQLCSASYLQVQRTGSTNMLAQLAQRAMDAVAAVASASSTTKPQPQQTFDHDADVQRDSDTTMLTLGAAAADDDDGGDKNEEGGEDLRAEEDEGSLENNETDHDHDQPRTTASAAPSSEEAQPVQDDDDPTRGKDGKQCLVAGIYYSASTAAYAASLQPTPAPARGSTTKREKKAAVTGTNWRSIAPSKTTAFPPPIFYGETLLEPPEDDGDSDDGEDDGIAARPFKLPFDILRDHWYAGGCDSNSTSTSGRRRHRSSKSKSQSKPTEEKSGSGETQRKGSSSANPNPRPGKGGDKTTEEDILKREQSKKPPPYRYIGKSQSKVPLFFFIYSLDF